jgi:dihydrofolate reductase
LAVSRRARTGDHAKGEDHMGRIVVSQFVSLDGVIEDPVGIEELGRGSWTGCAASGPEGEKFKLDEIFESEAMLLGRRTYEGYVAAWPSRDGEYADKINSMPKYVVSSTLEQPEWNNTTVLDGDVGGSVQELREQLAGTILIQGSGTLVHALMERDLVDEWRLMTFPIVVGAGARFFGDPGRAVPLRLASSRTVGEGITIATYEPIRG